jgi:hypothetical protein
VLLAQPLNILTALQTCAGEVALNYGSEMRNSEYKIFLESENVDDLEEDGNILIRLIGS